MDDALINWCDLCDPEIAEDAPAPALLLFADIENIQSACFSENTTSTDSQISTSIIGAKKRKAYQLITRNTNTRLYN